MATLRTVTALPLLILSPAMTGTEAQKPRDLAYRPNLVIKLGVRNLDKAIALYQDSLAGFFDPDGNALRLAGPPETAEPSR